MTGIDWSHAYGYPADPRVMDRGLAGIARYGPPSASDATGRNTSWMGDSDHVMMYHTTGWRLFFEGFAEGSTLVDSSGRKMNIPLVYTGGRLHMQAWRLAEAIMRHGWPT